MSERDKFLTEAMGYTNVRIDDRGMIYAAFPGDSFRSAIGYVDSWALFGIRWEWAQKQGWWQEFLHDLCGIDQTLIHPARFDDALYDFLEEREGGPK